MPSQTTSGLHPEILQAALEGLEAQLARIEEQIGHVHTLLGSARGGASQNAGEIVTGSAPNGRRARKGRRKRAPLSAEAKARISAAQKKRWAAAKRARKK